MNEMADDGPINGIDSLAAPKSLSQLPFLEAVLKILHKNAPFP